MADDTPFRDSPETFECANATSCPFYDAMIEQGKEVSLKGFVNQFCDGNPVECRRKQLAKQYGKREVPENMMPNGKPLPGTDASEWSETIVQASAVRRVD